MVAALVAADVPAELLVLPGADHGFAARVRRDADAAGVEAVLAFLAEG
jgi:dipeptidyl aminopeptidase/acylaminoacyl peptidase